MSSDVDIGTLPISEWRFSVRHICLRYRNNRCRCRMSDIAVIEIDVDAHQWWLDRGNRHINVRCHEDRCTKNKLMVRIPMRGLFLTCTENSFSFWTHIKIKQVRIYYLLKEITYLERWFLFRGANSPSSHVPCLKSTALAPLRFLTPCTCFSHTEHLFLYTKTTFTSVVLL